MSIYCKLPYLLYTSRVEYGLLPLVRCVYVATLPLYLRLSIKEVDINQGSQVPFGNYVELSVDILLSFDAPMLILLKLAKTVFFFAAWV